MMGARPSARSSVSLSHSGSAVSAKSAAKGFRVGDRLFATTGAGWEPVTVIAPSNRGGTIGKLRVRNAGGREYEASVLLCYTDNPAFRAFVAAIRGRNEALIAAKKAAQKEGLVLGGSACTKLPAYKAYQAAAAKAVAAAKELERTHPYR
jgi:hypothetical protein